ncbi:hypothetical protein ACLOJK_013073, partial [Asimina triloba]
MVKRRALNCLLPELQVLFRGPLPKKPSSKALLVCQLILDHLHLENIILTVQIAEQMEIDGHGLFGQAIVPR